MLNKLIMTAFHVVSFFSAILASVCSVPEYCEKRLERDRDYDNATITNSSYIREEILHVHLQSCAQKCLTYRCACSAILHSSQMGTCVLLSAPLDPQSIGSGAIEEGWEYYTTPKGCEPGWLEYSTHCYFIGQREVTWMEAKSKCEERCSYRVEIETKEESDWLAETFVFKDTCPSNIFVFCRAWTGGNDLRTEGRYQWNNANESMAFTNWDSNEPSITYPFQAKDSDCIHLLRNGKWNDLPCSTKTNFICEKA